jgi:hypothetical protein
VNIEEKLARLMRVHRLNAFDDDAATGDRHHRALMRLKRTRTFDAMCRATEDRARDRASERLLRMWA